MNIKKYLTCNDEVRVMAIDATEMVQKLRDIHELSNVCTVALGRVTIVASMIATTLKNDTDRLTIQIKGKGPLKSIVVCADKNLNVKGYVSNPDIELPLNSEGKVDVGGAIGSGTLTVIKDIGLKEPYVGTCELLTGEIGDDFAYYFNVSEQTPCVVSVGVLIDKEGNVKCAGGFIIEPLPECSEDTISKLEDINVKLEPVTKLMSDGKSIDDIVSLATGDKNPKVIYSSDAKIHCDCSKKRIENTIIALGKKDALNICMREKKLEVLCNFCRKKYSYTKEEVEELFKK